MTPELICVSKTHATFRLNGEVQQAEINTMTKPAHKAGMRFFIVQNEFYFLPDEFQPRKKR